MQTEPEIASPSVIAISWLAASAAFPLALIGAVFGQGLGAVVGGCHWIGISVPLDRQVWALVNQPVLNFASQPGAAGYWLGSMLLPLMVATATIGFLPRAQSLVTELGVVQVSWAMATVAVAWLPLLDADDGHLTRFLSLKSWSSIWVWLGPILAAGAGLLPALRLLEMARRRCPDIGRTARLFVVALHLGVPAVFWFAGVSLVHGAVLVFPAVALSVPVAAILGFAWLRYPSPYVRALELPR